MIERREVRMAAALALLLVAPGIAGAEGHRLLRGTVDALLDLDVRPFAIAHRGFGENLGGDHTQPIENTVAAVRLGFRSGASVVEIDVQLTRDGQVVAYHDDVLADLTCINTLDRRQLHARLPHVPTLEAVLQAARHFNQSSGPLEGIVIVELKAAAPLCDPNDTQDRPIVSAVANVVRNMHMTQQVLFTSFSPALLYHAGRKAPEIDRILAVSGLQFLAQAEIEAALQLPVTLIDKEPAIGLQWAEIGTLFRLPGYRSFTELLQTAALTDVRAVEVDLLLLHSSGAPLVAGLQAAGLKVFGFTANTEADWDFLESLGVNGIYTNDVPLGVRLQRPIP